jgi:hypothetical protein
MKPIIDILLVVAGGMDLARKTRKMTWIAIALSQYLQQPAILLQPISSANGRPYVKHH